MIDDELDELFGSNEENKLKLSYSRISDFDRNGPKALIKQKELDTKALRMGSVIDLLVFEPDKFNDTYYCYDGDKPTATLGKLCDIILENYIEVPSKETVLEIIKANKFWNNIKKIESLEKNFNVPEFWEYITTQLKVKDKIIINTPEKIACEEIAFILKTHEHSKDIINGEGISQFKFTYELDNVILRGIIDKVLIDYENKTIRFIDLKTGSNDALEFKSSFIKYRYYIQAFIYQAAFETVCKELNLDIEEFTLLPFQFLYISKSERIPLVLEVTDKWYTAARDGFVTTSGYNYKGVNTLIKEIYWHWYNKEYDIPKEIIDNKGQVLLEDHFISIVEDE